MSASHKDAQAFYETKQKAVKYYLENGVPQKMEEILNSMFYDDPEDIYGHLANYFDQYIKPAVITKRLSLCISPATNTHLPDNARLEDREADEQKRTESVKAAVNYINNEISSKLKDMKPTDQQQIDAILKGKGGKISVVAVIPEEPREHFPQGSEMVCAVSQAICVAGARAQALAQGVPLYEHISSLYHTEPCQLRMPLPIVTIMQSGKAALGKLNCVKEFMVIPSPGLSYTQSLDYITGIYYYIEKSLSSKGGVGLKTVSETGALCPVFEKPEQGLDLLQEAITAANLTPGEDIHIAINAAAHEMFDFEKGKYEVMTGVLKGADDLVDFWVELMSRYPSIMIVIDPTRKLDRDQWMRLCDRITEWCFVAGDRIFNRPGVLMYEQLPEQMMTGATVLAMENMTTLSDMMGCARKMEAAGNQIILSARSGETQDDFLADLAVGMNARFIKLGAPNRGERVSKFNRLLQIEAELEASGKLAPQVDHEFVHIALPPPEGEGEEGPPPASPASTKETKKEEKGKKK
ncbi:hypothetical protein BaRGS_00039047 [Batillaria attramentaria]|uniref:Enolase 4 n=1 Tax=Batillaria attramentaria TaxID=370345 RepID=A0ABD0J4B5_9CAEN